MGTLGSAHILLATLGVAVFALAAVLALLYLFQDRQLKRKRFDRVMGMGTPLETLDRLALRCVSIGFPGVHGRDRDGRDLDRAPRPPADGGGAAPRVPVRDRDLDRVRRAAGRPGRGGLAGAAGGLADARAASAARCWSSPPTSSGTRRERWGPRPSTSCSSASRTGPRRSAVRERLAVEPDAVESALAELGGLPGGARGGDALHLQPRRALRRRRRRRSGVAGPRRGASRGGRASGPSELGRAPVRAPRRRGRPPPVPRRLEPRLAGDRRAADPGPDQAGPRGRAPARHRGPDPERLLLGRVPGRAPRAARHRDRPQPGVGQLRRGRAGAPGGRRLQGAARAGGRRGQDVGAGGAHAAHAGRHADRDEPDPRARRGAGDALRARRSPTGTISRARSPRPTS